MSGSGLSREELVELVEAQAATITQLQAEVAELKRQLGRNSRNSSQPPSVDGPAVANRAARRAGRRGDGGGRKPGKQPGAGGREPLTVKSAELPLSLYQ